MASIGIALVLAACSSSPEEAPDAAGSATPSGPWSFVDDRPIEVMLDDVPQRIVAYETAAAALLGYGLDDVVGIFGSAPLEESSYLQGYDLTGIEDVGSVYGEVNFEAVAALAPDLIVTTAYIDERTGTDAGNIQLGGIVGGANRNKLEAIAPVVGIDELLPASQFIERFGELAASLGADLDQGTLAADRARFEEATEMLRSAVASNPGISVMAIYGNADGLFVAQPVPREFQDLPEFTAWGLNVVDPKSDDQYWELLSWEKADTYAADIILVDSRPGSPTAEDLAGISPTWSSLPAVEAGQTFEWLPYVATSDYATYAAEIERLAEMVATSKDVA